MVYMMQKHVQMFGFCPDKSTFENFKHGEELLKQCGHGSILQLHNWWQDPNTYYAFQSKAGCRWLSKNGGPKKFIQMVEQYVPDLKTPALADPFQVELICHSCTNPLETTKKNTHVKVCRCLCGTKVVHKHCYMPEVCPVCSVTITTSISKKALLKIN